MAGTRGERHTDGPDEIYIVAADGAVDDARGTESGGQRPPRRIATSRRRQAALLVVVALLAFSVGVGVGSRGTTGTAQRDPSIAIGSSTETDPMSGSLTAADSTSPSAESKSPAAAPSAATSAESAETVVADREPWPTAPGLCGYDQQVPLISGALPLDRSTGLSVLAGGTSGRIAVDGGTAGETLFSMPVSEIAEDSAGIVAIGVPDPCATDSPDATPFAFRIGDDGAPRQVYPPAHAQPASPAVWGLVSGGDRTYLAGSAVPDTMTSEGSGGDDPGAGTVSLIATDGSGAVAALPAGFQPIAGWRHMVVGLYVSSADSTYGPIQIYDLVKGGIVTQIAASSPQIVTGGSNLAWIDANCQARCTAHRYNMDTGLRTDVKVALQRSDYGGIGTVAALSSDGDRLAMVTYDPESDGKYDLGHPGGPARFAVLDWASGDLTTLPGIVRPPKSPFGAAFSPDGQWLMVAVNDGSMTRLLLYDHDLRGPYDPGIAVPASASWRIPLIVQRR